MSLSRGGWLEPLSASELPVTQELSFSAQANRGDRPLPTAAAALLDTPAGRQDTEPWTQPMIWQAQDHMAFSLVGGIAHVREPDGVNGFSAPLLYPTYVQELLAQEEYAGFQPADPPPADAVGPTGTKALCQFLSLGSVTAVLDWQAGRGVLAVRAYFRSALGPRRSTTTGCFRAPSVGRLSWRRANTIPGRVGDLIARDGVSPRISGRSRPPLGARPGDGRTWTCGAAWSARWPVKPEVAGSNPVRSAERSPPRPGFPPGGTRRAQWSCRRWSVWSGSSAGRARA